MYSVEKFVHRLSKGFSWVAMGLLVLLMLLPVVNISMRLFPLTNPLKGTFGLVAFISGFVASFNFAHCAVQKGHIVVDFVFVLLPKSLQVVIDCLASFLSTGVCVLIVWQSLKYAADMWRAGETSMTLHIPLAAIVSGIACGFAVLSLVYLVELFRTLAQGVSE
jgi:TRAP-type C4-dicarboxylate transport system permease small subunit